MAAMLAYLQAPMGILGPDHGSVPDLLASACASDAREAAALLSTTLRCADSGLLPHLDGLPLGALTASKRKLLSCLVGGTPSGFGSDVVAAGAALESAVRPFASVCRTTPSFPYPCPSRASPSPTPHTARFSPLL